MSMGTTIKKRTVNLPRTPASGSALASPRGLACLGARGGSDTVLYGVRSTDTLVPYVITQYRTVVAWVVGR